MGAALAPGDPAPLNGALPAALSDPDGVPFGVYLHVPFCRVRCGYCDFNTYTATELRGARQEDYADVAAAEIAFARRVLADAGRLQPAATVFFGGGTPTLLPVRDLAAMLDAVRSAFGIEPGAEVTVEANPDTVGPREADALAAAGVTRVSIGMQSAVPDTLRTLDRTHEPAAVGRAVAAVRSAGLAPSVDLIYGAPGETLEQWTVSVEEALALGTDHVSAYALIVEEGTALARRIRRGDLPAPDDDLQADMYELADDLFEADGLSWYEVSNWARTPAHRSRHNLGYWLGGDWWGVGPGAHSHIGGVRWWNVRHPAAYAQRLAAGHSPAAGREIPDAAARRLERVLLESRVRDGLEMAALPHGRAGEVAHLVAGGALDETAVHRGRIVLTRRGRLLADAVVRALTE